MSPCDLAVVGESPNSFVGSVLWGGADLMNVIAGRPRESCYVSSVSDALLGELGAVRPRLVLAFGLRAAMILVPGFNTMADHGRPVLGLTGKYVAMALWHPVDNAEVLGMIAADLSKVDVLLLDGLAELMAPMGAKGVAAKARPLSSQMSFAATA